MTAAENFLMKIIFFFHYGLHAVRESLARALGSYEYGEVLLTTYS